MGLKWRKSMSICLVRANVSTGGVGWVHQSGSLSSEFEYPTLLVAQCRYFRGIGLYTRPILTDCLSFNRHSYGELYVQV
jgi:hypothetical protein